MKFFLVPTIVSAGILVGIYAWLGPVAFITALLLTVLEVTLSFDNAVVNARVLMHMDETWRRRFLTWGMLIAVFGTRLVLPILIVSASVWLSPLTVAHLALFDPLKYAYLLDGAHYAIAAFGGSFLLMVALKYFINEAKTVHWIHVVERHLAGWGRIEAIQIGLALAGLALLSFFTHEGTQAVVLVSGIIGIVLFIAMEGLASTFSIETANAAAKGLTLFIYLNILDSAFSLDSVVGAFALTTAIPIIVAGLGIGAWYVRSLTIYFVERRTLETLTYLEHGAHWAIFGLAVSMFAGLIWHVPEVVTGGIGLAFVLAAYWSSVRMRSPSSV